MAASTPHARGWQREAEQLRALVHDLRVQLDSVLSQRNAASTPTPAETGPTAAPSGVSSQNVDEDIKLADAVPSSLTSVTLNFKEYMDITDEG